MYIVGYEHDMFCKYGVNSVNNIYIYIDNEKIVTNHLGMIQGKVLSQMQILYKMVHTHEIKKCTKLCIVY